ncbi:MAG: hypothetical protein AAFQ52_01790 [Chloroflexota bacterium]
MQPRPEKKKPKLTRASKITKALQDAPSIIVSNIVDDETTISENDNPTVPPASPVAD